MSLPADFSKGMLGKFLDALLAMVLGAGALVLSAILPVGLIFVLIFHFWFGQEWLPAICWAISLGLVEGLTGVVFAVAAPANALVFHYCFGQAWWPMAIGWGLALAVVMPWIFIFFRQASGWTL